MFREHYETDEIVMSIRDNPEEECTCREITVQITPSSYRYTNETVNSFKNVSRQVCKSNPDLYEVQTPHAI